MKNLVLFVIGLCLFSCASPEKPYFKELQNVKLDSFSLKKKTIRMKADAIFHNPNKLGANLSELDIDVFINGIKAFHLTQEIKAKMSPTSDFALPIICEVPLDEVVKKFDVSQLLRSLKLEYRVDGDLKVGLGKANLKVPISYEGEEAISFY